MPPAPPESVRYAEALLALAEAAGSSSRIEQELVSLLDLFETNTALRRFLADPAVKTEGKKTALHELLCERVSPVLLHFVLILQAEGVLPQIRAIGEDFFRLFTSKRRKVTGTLLSAVPVPDDKLAVIEREAGRVLGKDVHLRVRVETGIMGGMRIQVGDFILDGTVEHQFSELRRKLLG